MTDVKWVNITEAAEHNDTEAVRYFIETKHVAMTSCNADEQTAAHIAVKNGNLSLLKYLVNKDPSIVTSTDKDARNVLIQAVEQGALDVIKFLLEERMEKVTYDHNLHYGNTAVHWAALRGQFEILKYFFEDRGIDVNIRSDFGETPLFLAAEKVHMHIVKYLVEERKARVDIIDKNDNNVLYISARRGDLNVPRYLLDDLKKNINLNFRDFFGETVLHRAVKFKRLQFMEYLIEEKGVNVNIPDSDGKTPLHHAVETGNVTVVEYLIENGALTDVKNDYNKTAFEEAKYPEMIKYVRMWKPKSTSESPTSENSTSEIPTSESPTSERCRRSVLRSPITFNSDWTRERVDPRISSWSRDVSLIGPEFVPSRSQGFSQLDSVLIFASTMFRFSTIASHAHVLSSLVSPREILWSKIDPIAADAVEYMD